MKAKLIRKRLFAGIICLGLTGNLFLYNVSAAEDGQDSSTAKSALENQSGSSGKEENGQEQISAAGVRNTASQDENREPPAPDDSGQPDKPSQADKPGQSDNSGQPENSGQSDNPGQPDKDQQGQEPTAVSISREEMSKGLESGQEFQVSLILKNTSPNTDLKNVKLQIETPEGLAMAAEQKTGTIKVGSLAADETKNVAVKLSAGKLSGDVPTLVMKAEVSYEYQAEGQTRTGSDREDILLPVAADNGKNFVDNSGETNSAEASNSGGDSQDNSGGGDSGYEGGDAGTGDGAGGGASESGKKKLDPMTPNIIVSQYEYDRNITAGQEFELKMVLYNTSKQNTIENIVMSAEAGEALSIEDSSNTTYIERMKPQESVTKVVRLKALPQEQADKAKLELNFKYEYLKQEERTQVTSTEKLSVRYAQPDRFSLGDIQKEKEISANEETAISIPYVNKGKTTVSNVEARLKTEMASEETYKFLGNVEAGTSGTIDFFVTPPKEGKHKAKILVTYEDVSGNEKTVEKEVELTAAQGNPDEFSEGSMDGVMPGSEEMESGSAGTSAVKAVIPAAGVLSLAGVYIWRRRRRKRSLSEEEENL